MMGSIYLVDDHGMVRDAIKEALISKGYLVVGDADNPTTALADIQRLNPAILLLDLNLGLRSGFELLADMQQRHLPTRAIVLTMTAHAAHVAQAVRQGAHGYVLKGQPLDELIKAIDQVLCGHRHFVGEVAALAVEALTMTDSATAVESLSVRERQVVTLVVKGLSSTEIGQALHLSPKTVDSYRSRLMSKLQVPDVPALVRLAIREGLIDLHGH
jgi:two-component system invasion response regulator UvrY